MNIGSGLLFELENGKPKLIVLNRGDKGHRNLAKPKPRLPSIISSRQPSRLEPPRAEEQLFRKPNALNVISHQNKPGRGEATVRGRGQTVTSTKTQENRAPVNEVKNNAKVRPAKAQNVRANRKPAAESNKKPEPQVKPSNQSAALSDTASCPTNEQLQQITSNAPPKTEELTAECESKICETKEAETIKEETEAVDAPVAEKQARGLLRWIEERPCEDRAALKAKQAQWRKELEEQMALRKIQQLPSARIQGGDDVESQVQVRSSINYEVLPAAIRPSLRVGECEPVDEQTQEQKLEEGRRWIQDINKQREEASERKRLEKLQQQQTEDQQLWRSHFDSLHRPALVPPLVSRAERAEERVCSSADRAEAGGSSSLSQWDDVSVRASVESNISPGRTSRVGHLRTMTSLLDPTELEERARRRLKQQEQQRALKLQVEERRQHREEEEARRKREEEEEERRVQQQRETLQRQYERDTLRERHKEQSTPEEEASVRDSTEPPRTPSPVTNQEESPELEAGPTTVNHHTDTAVQTEDVHILAASADRAQLFQMFQMAQRGAEVYEPFARAERSKKDVKRPEWNTQRPSRRFVPASQRYPEELQRQRQESRLRRQAQLLFLQKNASNNIHNTDHSGLPDLDPAPQQLSPKETPRAEDTAEQITERGRSPSSPLHSDSPALGFLPYVRTDEVFGLNSRDSEPAPRLQQKSPREEEISRGLARLREGLLQKQRELESEMSRSCHDDGLGPLCATVTLHREL